MAGLTLCDIWRENVLVDECKVLMLVDEDPFFNETDFIEALYKTFQSAAGRENSNLSFFAEKFGYKRFSISYETDDLLQMRITETDDLLQMRITQALFDLELDATKEVVGPVPELKVPPMPSLK